ncbi:MAG: PH domain-containing protein [Xanthomonadales bacterium]|nr:PH domain-containing protein [Xanthomonadales bacterium]MBP6078946.1 PH domain-containing protein [Xanthomonadales bacterium]MBP7622637.1 PH domain-containing protein [Xanthomonadales bacterium]
MPMGPEARGDERRLHPFSWLFVLVAQLREVAFPAIVLLLFGRGQWWEFLAIVGAVLLALYSLVYSFGFRYRIAADELVVREGIFDRTERHVPFVRIQNIARRSNLLHRLFGVTELRLESGGGVKPEAVMKVLRVTDADALVALLRAQRTAASADVSAHAHASDVLLRLSLPELVRFGLISNRGMVVVAGAFAAFWQFNPTQPRQVMRMPTAWVERAFGEVSAHHYGLLTMVVGGASVLLLLFAALRLLSVLLAILVHHGFTLELEGDRLGAGGGLLTHAHGSARIDRLQMLHIEESLLHRAFRRLSLKTDVAGGVRAMNDQSGKLHWLAPLASASQVDGLLARILQAPALAALPWRPLHPRAWRRRARWPTVFWLFATAGLTFWFGTPGLLALIGVPWSAWSARGWAAFTRYAMDDRFLTYREGWWSRRYALIELDKLQVVELRQSPFDRRHAMASIRVDTMAADPLGSGIDIPCLPIAEARALFAVLARRCAGHG